MVGLKVVFQKENGGDEIHRNFLMKIGMINEHYVEIAKEVLIDVREIEANTKILPAVENLLQSAGVTDKIAPK